MYAIVDIETTGGSAAESCITEIAIVLHNGREVEGSFSSLIHPQQPIPRYIEALTGISNEMVADAPLFEVVAPQIMNLLKDRIFVAHNVNFDYSFVAHQLSCAGYAWQAKKLCTVRYARKVFPGQNSYSLGNICRQLGIENNARHRAGGDADATVELFEMLLQQDKDLIHLQSFLKGHNPESYLPMHLPTAQLEALPHTPGVYYFKDATGKILYIGKANNLKQRVRSHFANNSQSKRKQDLLRNVHRVDYRACVSTLHALVLEEMEIKKWWPLYNRSQKRPAPLYGLYTILDQRGLMRLVVEKARKYLPAIVQFHSQAQGFQMGRQLLQQFELNEQLIFATGHCDEELLPEQVNHHNLQMQEAMKYLKQQQPSLHLCQHGYSNTGQFQTVHFLISKGTFAGVVVTEGTNAAVLDELLKQAEPVADNDYIKSMIHRQAELHPEWVVPVE